MRPWTHESRSVRTPAAAGRWLSRVRVGRVARACHHADRCYPEARSANKGVEPEGLEVGRWGGRTLLFVAAERANVVGVYDVSRRTPELLQLLPTGIGPEGLKFTKGGTLVVTAEEPGLPAQPVITFFRPGSEVYPPRMA